jgi:hypothetical protein
MAQERQIPTALSIVAYLFLVFGVLTAIDMIFRLTRGEIYLDAGILGIWIFAGLRRYSRGWRTCALVVIWIAFIVLPLAIVYALFEGGPAHLEVFGQRVASVSPGWVVVVAALFFPLEIWQYRVLTRPDIYRLFYGDSDIPTAQPFPGAIRR